MSESNSDTEGTEEGVEAPKVPTKVDGRKKPRTEKQMENMKKALDVKLTNDQKRKESKELEKATARFECGVSGVSPWSVSLDE